MNSDSPLSPGEENEARLTALLLGELSVAEAAAMRRAIEQDAELAQLYERLKRTINLVQEAAVNPMEQVAAQAKPLRMSEENRQRLLMRFRTATPREFPGTRRRELPWFVPIGIAAGLMAMVGSVALLPGFGVSRREPKAMTTLPPGESAWFKESEMRVNSPDSRSESEQQLKVGPENLQRLQRSGAAGKTLPTARNSDLVTSAPEQSDSLTRTLSDETPGTVSNGGIALPDIEDSVAVAGVPTVTTEVASKPNPAPDSRVVGFGGSGRFGGGVGGGSVGAGGTYAEAVTPPPGANLTVTATISDNGRTVPGFTPQATAPQQPPRDDNLVRSERELWKDGRYVFTAPMIGGKPIGELEVPKAMGVAGTTLGTSIVTVRSTTAPIAPTTGAALPASDQGLVLNKQLNDLDSKQNVSADAALALGDIRSENLNLFQGKENAGSLNAWYVDGLNLSSPAQLNLAQAGTALSVSPVPQVAAGNDYELAPLPSASPQITSEPQRAAGIVTASPDVRDLTRDLAAPLAPGQQVAQTDQPQSALGYFDSLSSSKEPSPQKKEKLPEIGLSEWARRSDADGDQSILAERGEENSAALKMEPQLMRRYGLLRPGLEESKSKAATTVGEKPQSLRQSIVLPQGPSDGVESRALRESRRSPNGTAAPEKVLALQEKKRELEGLVQLRDGLSARANSEKVDATDSKGSFVKIVDPADVEPESNPSLLEQLRRKLTGGVEKVARIEITKDGSDLAPTLMGTKDGFTYDPYFIQTDFERIRSKAVLYKVIEKLNLNEAWAIKNGREKLKTAEAFQLLLKRVDVRQFRDTGLLEIQVKSDKPEEAALIANTIAEVYRDLKEEQRRKISGESLNRQLAKQEEKVVQAQKELEQSQRDLSSQPAESALPKATAPALIPQPEIQTRENAFSTFSLNVSDVSFKLAAASLEKGVMPEPATVRSEEFINAFNYRDSEPPPDVPIAFAWERARYPFAHNRDLLRFSIKTAAEGRQAERSLNLVLLLDNSGSMERADRVRIVREALRVLAGQLQPQDKLSVIAFARTARLCADGVAGNQAGQIVEQVSNLTPQGGTNLEEAMNLAYQTALRHYVQGGVNRVVLLTDGAANLGNVSPDSLKQKVETHRKQGIALDCFGIGWEGYNDDLLEVLSRNGDGRYGFINTPEEATSRFAGQLAGALRVAASDVKVQVEFNPKRVTAYRQIGYAKHQLTQEQFRDNTVDAAEIGAAESGNALYVVEVNPRGEGLMAIVRVRFKVPGTAEYREQEWIVPDTGSAVALEQASSAMRLAATASAFSEWLVSSPYATEATPDRLLAYLSGVPETYGIDPRPKQLESMIRQAKSIGGR